VSLTKISTRVYVLSHEIKIHEIKIDEIKIHEIKIHEIKIHEIKIHEIKISMIKKISDVFNTIIIIYVTNDSTTFGRKQSLEVIDKLILFLLLLLLLLLF
tara:strand:- start:537 stop:836 length:300 start_codon:yes stop_codon:yes gene_type:complete